MDSKAARIRALNDELRQHHTGGTVLITAGIQQLGTSRVAKVLKAVSTFDAFTSDNDPYEEHDCAILEVEGERILFKIDYYDLDLSFASSDPSDPAVTRRILTVMLAAEY